MSRLVAPAAFMGVLSLSPACARPPQPRPGIVVVLVDQLRADSAEAHLSQTMRSAGRGAVVSNMRSAAPWTYPSVISLMSGLHPHQHGAGGHLKARLLSRFDPALPLLPGLLRGAGYRTAGFVANPFFHHFNAFHQGFDHFDISFVGDQGNRIGDGKGVWTPRMFADSINRAILEHYAGSEPSRPEFTYVHYMDVHGPWGDAPFLTDDLLGRTGLLERARALRRSGGKPSPEPVPWDAAKERAFYEAATEFVDGKILELYGLFMRRYRGDLIFIVTSDHGRALDDDESVGPGLPLRKNKRSLHDFNLRVPFLILPSQRVAQGRVLTPCSNIDVAPTLLEWLGLPALEASPGRSFLRELRGQGPVAGRPLYASVSFDGYRSDAIVHESRKLIRWLDLDQERAIERQLFDLQHDPRELSPLAGEPTELARRLGEAAREGARYEAVFEGVEPELLERLRGLGYLR